MKKLTIEHLAAYLPYGVRAYGKYEHPFALESDSELERYSYALSWNTMYGCLQNQERLILRPLSDLTREITHNGETFVPIDWIHKNTPIKVTMCTDANGKSALFCENIQSSHYNAWPHSLVRTLLHLHFDVYGLIDSGLAIDINTLTK